MYFVGATIGRPEKLKYYTSFGRAMLAPAILGISADLLDKADSHDDDQQCHLCSCGDHMES